MDPLTYLTEITFILLIGLFFALLSNKIKVPNILFLMLIGIIIGRINLGGVPFIELTPTFTVSVAILALVMIIFDGSANMKLKDFDHYSTKALQLFIIFLMMNIIFLSLATYFLFSIRSIPLVIMLSILMSATAADIVLMMMKTGNIKMTKILGVESLINTPLIVLLPFVILSLTEGTAGGLVLFSQNIGPFFQQIITGVGAGMVVGVVLFKILKRKYLSKQMRYFSQLSIIVSALLTYVLAENLKGNGVLAVTTLGLFYGTTSLNEKVEEGVENFSKFITNTLEIMVFFLAGMVIVFPLNFSFLAKAFFLYIIHLALRYLSVTIVSGKKLLDIKEKMFLTLVIPKGLAVVTVVFMLATKSIANIDTILSIALIFVLYSVIISTISVRFSEFFLGEDISKKEL